MKTCSPSKATEFAKNSLGIRKLRSASAKNDVRRKVERIVQIAVSEAAQKRAQDHTQATKLLRHTGTPLLTAVSRYAQAVKILGGDRILEAARNFARQKPKRRKPRAVRPIAAPVIHLKKRRTVNVRDAITICTPNELRGLLTAAPGWFRPVLAIQAFSGLRSTEVLRLDWEDVKLDLGHIEVATVRTKTKASRLAPIPPNLVRWLAHAAKSSGKVFPYSRVNLDQIHASTATTAEVAWKPDALRHSFISYRAAQTFDVPRVSLESGTPPGMIFRHYRTLVGEMEARQWFTIAP
jgi:integrase